MPVIAPKTRYGVGANTCDKNPSPGGNQIIPCSNLSWDTVNGNSSYTLDFSQVQNFLAFGAVQGLLVNNQNNSQILTISYPLYNYSVAVAPYSLAWLPIEIENPAQLTVSSVQATGNYTQITALNFRPDPAQFAIASGGQSPASPLYVANVVVAAGHTYGQLVMNGAAQTLAVANGNRKGLLIDALSTNAASVWVYSNGATPSIGGGGIELTPGEKFVMDGSLIDQTAFQVIGTNGDKVNVVEYY